MLLRPKFNEYLADAYCFALMANDTDQAESIRALDDRLTGFLIEKFCEALDSNDIALAKALYNTGHIDINGRNAAGDTPLLHILRRRPTSGRALYYLLNQDGLDINAADKDGFTPLMRAARYEDANLVGELVKHPDIDLNAQNKNGTTAFMIMVSFENPRIVEMMLLQPTLDISIKDNEGRTAADYANRWGNIKFARMIKPFYINVLN